MSGYRLFVGQLVRDVRRRELEDAFGKYGDIARIDIKNGFGFIEYEHSRDAEDAVRKLDGTDFLGRRIIVEFARGKKRDREDRRRNTGPERSDHRVIVEGLARGTSWQDLKDAFRSSGDILFTDVRRDRYDDYYGIVEFRFADDIDNAIRKMDGAEVNGNKIRVKEDKKRKRSRSRSEKRRRKSKSRSRSPKRGSRSRSPKRGSRSKSGSRSRSPKRKSEERKSEERKGSPSRERDSKPRGESVEKRGSKSPEQNERGEEDRKPENNHEEEKEEERENEGN